MAALHSLEISGYVEQRCWYPTKDWLCFQFWFIGLEACGLNAHFWFTYNCIMYFVFFLPIFFLFLLMSGVGKYAGQRKMNPASSKMQMRYASRFSVLSYFLLFVTNGFWSRGGKIGQSTPFWLGSPSTRIQNDGTGQLR